MRGIRGERGRLALAGLATTATFAGMTGPAVATEAHAIESVGEVDKSACPGIVFKGSRVPEGVPKHPKYASNDDVKAAIQRAMPLGEGFVKAWFDFDGKLWTSFPPTLTQNTETTLFAKGLNIWDGKQYSRPTPWAKVRIHETEGLTFCAQIQGKVTIYNKRLRPVVKNFIWQSEAMTFKRVRKGGIPYPGELPKKAYSGIHTTIARSESGKHPHEGKEAPSVSFRWKRLFIGDENGYELFDANAVKPLAIKKVSFNGDGIDFRYMPWNEHESNRAVQVTPLLEDARPLERGLV